MGDEGGDRRCKEVKNGSYVGTYIRVSSDAGSKPYALNAPTVISLSLLSSLTLSLAVRFVRVRVYIIQRFLYILVFRSFSTWRVQVLS